MDQKTYEEQRRAVRISPSPNEVEVVLSVDGQHHSNVSIADMSTMGMGLQLNFDPEAKPLKILFRKPTVLTGLEIGALIRNKKVINTETESPNYFLGLEYVFSSSDQQNLLLRWLTTFFQDHLRGDTLIPPPIRSSGQSTQYAGKTESLEVRFPQHESEMEESFLLLQPLKIHHALLQTKYFLAINRESITGVVPLIVDTISFKLPADRLFPTYLDGLRSGQRRIGEIAAHRFNDETSLLKNQPSAILRKLNILFSMFFNMAIYSYQYANLTDLVVIAPPTLQEFYRLWFFQDLRDQVDISVLRNEPGMEGARFMRLDLLTFKAILAEKRPELFNQLVDMEQSPKVMNHFQTSFYPHKKLMEKWFTRPKNLFEPLNSEQRAYFQMLVPELGL